MKKVLIITYYWPPSGGIGVLRCLKFAKYLRQFGWEPIIYTAKNAQYPYYDESNTKDIPKDITILRHPIIEPFSLFKKLTGKRQSDPVSNPLVIKNKGIMERLSIWIRANFFIPDARCLWIKPSVKFLSQYLSENTVDALLSDGPPHTNTVIACKLSKKFNIPWLADFQDPWTQVDYYRLFPIGRRANNLHRALEQETFHVARKITIASPTWKRDLENIGAQNVDVIYWGYDEDDFTSLTPASVEKFTIFHAGIFGKDRLSLDFFEALREILKEVPTFANDLKLEFLGMIDNSIEDAIQQNDLTAYSQLEGTQPRNAILARMQKAYLLLLPLNQSENIEGRLPGKLYEYLRAHRWIYAIGPPQSDVSQILSDTDRGQNAPYGDKATIKHNILHFYDLFQKGIFPDQDTSSISKFSVENQTKQLSQFLHQIIPQHEAI